MDSDLLRKICVEFEISEKELRERLSLPQCEWVHKRKTSLYKKGERCPLRCLSKENVFCQKHHYSASKECNSVTLGAGNIKRQVYIPDIGLAETTDGFDKRVLNFIQGSKEKFYKFSLENSSEKMLE